MPREDDELDTDERAVVAKLRELPPEGEEPDWNALEAAIRAEVGDRAPAPWWRNWRWIVPIWALATTATVALIVLRGDDDAQPREPSATAIDAGVPTVPARVDDSVHAIYLDGEVLELDDIAGPELEALDALDRHARAALDADEEVSAGLLPVADYGWIDELDDDAIDAAEAWLKRKRS